MRNACQVCGGSAQTGALICRSCERRCRRNLGDMEAHRAELETTLTRQVRMTAPSDGGRSANTPLPYQDIASDLLASQRAILASWCKLIHDELDMSWPPRDTVMSMAMHLEAHMGELRLHEAVAELVAELDEFTTAAVECIDYPEDRHRVFVSTCIVTVEAGQLCPGQIQLHFPHVGETYADCRHCGSRWDGTQLNRLGQRIKQIEAA